MGLPACRVGLEMAPEEAKKAETVKKAQTSQELPKTGDDVAPFGLFAAAGAVLVAAGALLAAKLKGERN